MTTPYVPPPRSWRSRLREVFTERLGLKAIALLLSVLLWLVVQARRPAARGYVGAKGAPASDSARRAPASNEVRAATAGDSVGRGGEEIGRDTATKSLAPSPPRPLTSAPAP